MPASLSRRALFGLATSGSFERVALGAAPGRALAWRAARRYVAGTSAEEALARVEALRAEGLSASLDVFGERVSDPSVADAVAAAYVDLAGRVAAPTWLSIDLSHLGLARDPAGARRRLSRVVAALPEGVRLQVGAEEAALADAVLEAVLAAGHPERLGATVQANLPRAAEDLDRLAAAGVLVRLVKGAYVEPEALPYGPPTDLAYLALARQAARRGARVALATHHALLREACRAALPGAEVEQLLGVRHEEAVALARAGVAVRVYVPFGPDWFRYTMRRLAEARGA